MFGKFLNQSNNYCNRDVFNNLWFIILVDHLLSNQLKESNFRSPEISDVVYDQGQVLGLMHIGITKWEKNASAYWDAETCKWAL